MKTQKQEKPTYKILHVRVEESIYDDVVKMATQYSRSVSNMSSLLITESVQNRQPQPNGKMTK